MANPNNHPTDPDEGYFSGAHTEYVIVSTHDPKEGVKHEIISVTEHPEGEA